MSVVAAGVAVVVLPPCVLFQMMLGAAGGGGIREAPVANCSKANEFCCPAGSFPPSILWWSVSRVLLVSSSCWLEFLAGFWYFKFRNLQLFEICL